MMNIKRLPVLILKTLFSRLKFKRERNRWLKKMKKVYKNVVSKHQKIPVNTGAYKEKWQPFGKRVDTRCCKIYAYISGVDDSNYVPEDVYYLQIEPALNRIEFSRVYRDKNFFDRYNARMPGIFPAVLLRNIEGVYCDKDYNRMENVRGFIESLKEEKVVVKPSLDTGGGKNIHFFTRENGILLDKKKKKLSFEFLENELKKNFLIQDYIKQHDYMKTFNKTSLNTVRIYTYRSVKDDKVAILTCGLRMGGKEALVDNRNAGGVAVGIAENGYLGDYATDKLGNKFFTPPSAPGVTFSHLGPVPHFDEMKQMAVKLAKDYYYFRILAFDFCLEANGRIRLIEINFGGLGIVFQMNCGPLFGEYTDEVINYCAGEKNE